MPTNAVGISDEARELRELVRGADSIELSLTLPEHSYRSAAAALGVDPLDAPIRQVFWFDTADLDLNKAGLDFLASTASPPTASADQRQAGARVHRRTWGPGAVRASVLPHRWLTGPRRGCLGAAGGVR